MRIKRYINMAFIIVTVLASCSKNDTPVTTESSDENEFKKLASIEISSTEGTSNNITSSRTPGSVSGGKPTTIYYGNSVNLLKAEVTNELNESSTESNYDFDTETAEIVTHTFNNTVDNKIKNYDLYYKLNVTSDNKDKGGSLSGTIELTTKKDNESISINLTTFKLNDLNNIGNDSILYGLNNFYYGEDNNKLKGIGSVLFYLTYNPKETSDGITLPKIENSQLDILKDNTNEILYNEYPDNLFVSDEILIAATKDKVYVFKTLKKHATPGYKLLRSYDRKDEYVKRMKIDMARLTTIVNASFLINDTHYSNGSSEPSYFVKDNKETSLENFKKKFGIYIKDIKCPHATIDGVNTLYKINDRKNDDNTYNPGKLVLWSEKLDPIIGINGMTYEKTPSFTDVIIKEHVTNVDQGLGILGDSYSVIFKSEIFAGNELRFYIVVDVYNEENKKTESFNVIVYTVITEDRTITLSQNTVHQLILLVDANTFANELKAIVNKTTTSRANSNDFIEIEVPSENLFIN